MTIGAAFSPDRDVVELKERVGMDEFYAKLAHYVRLAEAGGKIEITRWARPVATLGPPPLKPAAPPADA